MGLAAEHLRTVSRVLLAGDAYIDGKWLRSEARDPVSDPATGEQIADVTRCTTDDVDRAIDAASAAFVRWRERRPAARGAVLRAWAEAMRGQREALATLITAEQGKPLREAPDEVDYGAGFLDWFAGEGERAYGESIPSHKPASFLVTRLQPVGVVAAVTPWNFPSAMIARKAAAAMAAGCPVIVKPAPETPLSSLALARLAESAGVPPGVFQVAPGDAVILTQQLLRDTRVRALSFTGSTAIGRLLLRESAATVKKVSLELGGHAPFIVFDDADLESSVRGAMSAKFATSGQDCLAANRIFVQRRIYEPFIKDLAAAIRKLRVGHGFEAGTDIGPMNHPGVATKCRRHVEEALQRGARLIAVAWARRSESGSSPRPSWQM